MTSEERERERNSGEGETRREYGGTRPAAREMQKARATKRLAAREKTHCNKNAGKGGRKDTTKRKRTTKLRTKRQQRKRTIGKWQGAAQHLGPKAQLNAWLGDILQRGTRYKRNANGRYDRTCGELGGWRSRRRRMLTPLYDTHNFSSFFRLTGLEEM